MERESFRKRMTKKNEEKMLSSRFEWKEEKKEKKRNEKNR